MAVTKEAAIGGSHNGCGLLSVDEYVSSCAGKRAATERLIETLARSINPDTGRLYTYLELADIFDTTYKTIGEKLSERDVFRQPRPEVRQDQLPENESAFFLGLAQGDYNVYQAHWGKDAFVVVGTDSQREQRRELLRKTIGTWGEIHEGSRGVKIYLESPTFDFMATPALPPRYLDARSRFAPFVLGTIAARLSDRENRVSLSNGLLLRVITRQFFRHYGFSMGNFRDQRNSTQDDGAKNRRSHSMSFIVVKNPAQVFRTLIGESSVASLPFVQDLRRNIA